MDGWAVALTIVGVFALLFLLFLFVINSRGKNRYAAAKDFRSENRYATDPSVEGRPVQRVAIIQDYEDGGGYTGGGYGGIQL